MSENPWGFKNLTKWAVVVEAPLSESGLNEIVATSLTKEGAKKVAAALGIDLGRKSHYTILPMRFKKREVSE